MLHRNRESLGGSNFDTNPAYDREATQRLVYMFLKTGLVEKILFNDPKIKGVEPWPKHSDHLHIKVKLP